MKKQPAPLGDRIADADMRGSNWLAKGNEFAEAGNKTKAEECYDKGQFWIDRSNKLREQAWVEKYRDGIQRIAKMAEEDCNWRIATAAKSLLE